MRYFKKKLSILVLLLLFVPIPLMDTGINDLSDNSHNTSQKSLLFNPKGTDWQVEYDKTLQSSGGVGSEISLDALPVVSQPDDITYREGQTGYSITWQVDGSGGERVYQIYQNKTQISEGSWGPNSEITQNVDGLTEGLYNYTIVVSNSDGSVSDQVWVEVVSGFTFVDTPDDLKYSVNSTGNELSWTIAAESPNSYTISRNETVLISSGWTSLVPITLNIDGLVEGVYEYSIIADIENGDSLNDSVFVTVLSGPFFVDEPEFSVFAKLQTNYTLSWKAETPNPSYFEIYNSSTVVKNDTWTDSSIIGVNISSNYYGNQTFSASIYDQNGESASSLRTVVFNPVPEFIKKPNDTLELEEDEPNIILWEVYDEEPDSYVILVDGLTYLRNDTWNSPTNITFHTKLLGLDNHNITLILYDSYKLSSNHTIQISVVDTTNPIIDESTGNLNVSYVNEEIILQWNVTETHPKLVSISINGSQSTNYDWSTTQFDFVFPNRTVGDYSVIAEFIDTSNNSIISDTTVTIIDDIKPELILSPSITYVQYDLRRPDLLWQFSDYEGGLYTITQNGSTVQQGSWGSNSPIIHTMDQFTTGTYLYHIEVFDKAGNTANSSKIIEVLPRATEKPSINLPAKVYENQILTVSGNWITSNQTEPVRSAWVMVGLLNNNSIINTDKTQTGTSGEFQLSLDHNGLSEGNQVWQFKFTKSQYQNWTLEYTIEVFWQQVEFSIDTDRVLEQGESYIIKVTIHLNTTNQLFLNTLETTNTNNSVYVSLTTELTFMNKTTSSMQLDEQTVNNQVSFEIPPSITQKLRSINQIKINLTDGQYLKSDSLVLSADNLPKIKSTGVINWLLISLNITLAVFLVVISLVSVLPLYVGIRWFVDLIVIFKDYDKIGYLEELSNIYSIILFSRNGILYYDREIGKRSKVDGSLFAGLTTAISHFLDEISPSTDQNYKEIKNQGLSVTIISQPKSIIAIVAENSLSPKIRRDFQNAHRNIEANLGRELESDIGNLPKHKVEYIDQCFINQNIPISVLRNISIDTETLDVLYEQDNFPEPYRSYLKYLYSFNQIVVNSTEPLTLQDLRDYLLSQGVRKQILGPMVFNLMDHGAIS